MPPSSLRIGCSTKEDGVAQCLLPITAYGVRFIVKTNNLDLLENIIDYLPPASKWSTMEPVHQTYLLSATKVDAGRAAGQCSARVPSDAPCGTEKGTSVCSSQKDIDDDVMYSLHCGQTCLVCCNDLDRTLITLESAINIHVASSARRRLFVHAGVIEWQNVAIVLPGRSFSGKTSLVEALIEAGARYYSDEYAVFDASGHVHPFPRALSIRGKDGARQRRLKVPPRDVGREPIPVGLIVNCCYREGAFWDVTPVSCGSAMLSLLANTIPARTRPAFALSILGQVVRDVRAVSGVRGEAREAVRSILELVR